MAKIIGGLAVSHTPTIGFAVDHNKQDESAWAPIFESFAPMQKWLEEKKPDALVYIFNDHVTSFFFDHYSAFTLGIDDHYEVADEGGGARDLPAVKGHAALSQHIGASLMADEFDMSFFQDKPLDHGLFSPLSALMPHEGGWPTQIVPLQIGVLQFPIPTARRCYKLGQALRRAIESFPEDLNVAIVATGGVSHQVHGERCGFNNPAWDEQFVDMIVNDPERLTEMTLAEFATLGGMEGAEVIMWLVMRGALSANVKKLHQAYYLPSMTGIATLILENQSREAPYDVQQRQRDKIAQQMAGVEKLPGTYPFTQARSLKALRINRFLHRLIQPAWRERFLTDQHALFAETKLTGEEQTLLRELDWRGMIHYGVSFFLLEKLGAVVGVSNLHIYSAMRGETLEEFQKTRNQQVLYSVAGKAKA
ncbi:MULTISPECIES: gallate dioxygenase [unclassified Rahnella]|uniref:gallate dioxygenase n=1 Tax=Rahnella TaxID=34037 RepID=UPI0006FF3011|nr:gallate dioxygenase [Rahnella sp. Larv3_ips]KQN50151.1 protocatechuate 3,4-dioxygenase [Serratia sp. Leaf51]MBB6113756.1 gallate dioxygenase [Rahnella inusitata]THD42236.1 gallate dioxygenase [Enterobacteriaceae bacterium ML5]